MTVTVAAVPHHDDEKMFIIVFTNSVLRQKCLNDYFPFRAKYIYKWACTKQIQSGELISPW